MTCPPKTDRAQGGFTLLEIIIVLAISGLIVGGAIATVVLASSQRKLTLASSDIELLAKKARTSAILHQTPYAIEFHPGFVRLLPLSEASEIQRTTALGNAIGGTSSNEENAPPRAREEIEIDPDLSLTIRRWNTEKFLTPTENFVPIWRFDPEGLSEPITVRFSIDESYAQDTYHPLTASIANSELEAN